MTNCCVTTLANDYRYLVLAHQNYNYRYTDDLPFERGEDLKWSEDAGYLQLTKPPRHQYWIVELATGYGIEILRTSRFGDWFVFVYDKPQDENGNPHPIEAYWIEHN